MEVIDSAVCIGNFVRDLDPDFKFWTRVRLNSDLISENFRMNEDDIFKNVNMQHYFLVKYQLGVIA